MKELLLSRTVEPNLSKPAINNEKNCEIDVPAREKGVGTSRTDENLPNAAGHVTVSYQSNYLLAPFTTTQRILFKAL